MKSKCKRNLFKLKADVTLKKERKKSAEEKFPCGHFFPRNKLHDPIQNTIQLIQNLGMLTWINTVSTKNWRLWVSTSWKKSIHSKTILFVIVTTDKKLLSNANTSTIASCCCKTIRIPSPIVVNKLKMNLMVWHKSFCWLFSSWSN